MKVTMKKSLKNELNELAPQLRFVSNSDNVLATAVNAPVSGPSSHNT